MSSGQDWKLVPFKASVAVGRLSITSRQQSLLLLQQRQNAFSKCCLFHSFTPVSPSSASERLTVHTFLWPSRSITSKQVRLSGYGHVHGPTLPRAASGIPVCETSQNHSPCIESIMWS